jgi:hypothetical protein
LQGWLAEASSSGNVTAQSFFAPQVQQQDSVELQMNVKADDLVAELVSLTLARDMLLHWLEAGNRAASGASARVS